MKKALAALLWFLLAPALAFAQSSPGLYQGQVPTAAQWNSYFVAKQDYLGFTPINPSTMVGTSPIVVVAGSGVVAISCPTCLTSGGVSSVSNSDSTLTISPTTGAVVASINLTHANTWTAVTTFSNATASVSNSTGAVVISTGGLGVGGTGFFGGDVAIGTNKALYGRNSVSSLDKVIDTAGDVLTVGWNFNSGMTLKSGSAPGGGNYIAFATSGSEWIRLNDVGRFNITTTTAATLTTNGALVVAGGVGIGGAIFAGGALNLSNGVPNINCGTSGSISCNYTALGSGSHNFYSAGGSLIFQFSPVTTSGVVNYLQFVGNTTGNYPYLAAQGSDSNVGMTILLKGSGSSYLIAINSVANLANFANGVISFYPTTDATNTTNASVTMAGGLAVAKNIYATGLSTQGALSGGTGAAAIFSNAGASGLEVFTQAFNGGSFGVGTYLQAYNRSGAAYIALDTIASQFRFYPSGSSTVSMTVITGVQLGAPTGGDKGVGTINATGYYQNNKALGVVIASGAKALATSAIASAACSSAQTDTATGTLTTDAISISFNADPTAVTGYVPLTSGMLTIIPYPTADTVNFKVCNNTNASITPGAVTLNWRVVR